MHLFVYSYVDLSGVIKQAFWESETEAVNVSRIGEKLAPSHKLLRVYRLSDGHCVWDQLPEAVAPAKPSIVSAVLADMIRTALAHRERGVPHSEAVGAVCADDPDLYFIISTLLGSHYAAMHTWTKHMRKPENKSAS